METTENNQENNSKVEKKFESIMKTMVAVLGGKEKFSSTKLPADELSEVVTTLFEEDKKVRVEAIKEKLKNILKSYTELTKEVKAKEKELQQLTIKKKKEFNEAAEALFKEVESLDQTEKDYYTALDAARTGSSSTQN